MALSSFFQTKKKKSTSYSHILKHLTWPALIGRFDVVSPGCKFFCRSRVSRRRFHCPISSCLWLLFPVKSMSPADKWIALISERLIGRAVILLIGTKAFVNSMEVGKLIFKLGKSWTFVEQKKRRTLFFPCILFLRDPSPQPKLPIMSDLCSPQFLPRMTDRPTVGSPYIQL